MNELMNITKSSELTMSSREIAEICEKRHDNVKRDIEHMLKELEIDALKFEGMYLDAYGREKPEYVIPADLIQTLVSGYSIKLRYRMVKHLEKLAAEKEKGFAVSTVPTTAEAFASAFQMLADAQNEQKQQKIQIERIEGKIERVEVAQTVLRSRPANAEGITHIRKRIGKKFGLSAAVIDEVMRQSPYAPKPAGMVRNDHVDADGSLYPVYWQKDITAVFRRFVEESQKVTDCFFIHPFVDGRFRLSSGVVH